MSTHSQIKVVGSNGQISLGKEFAGKTVIIDQISEGSWVIKAGQFIPDSEKWIYTAAHLEKLENALDWAQKNKAVDNFDSIIKDIEHGKNKNRHE
ncbi:MAG: hypothetical protein NTZ67_01060 [Gammaproteobacteria bacterium]|nr:hypothetical protein [Gammaproteobacteria bacterium]